MAKMSRYGTVDVLDGLDRLSGIDKNGGVVNFSMTALIDFFERVVLGQLSIYDPARNYKYKAKNIPYVSYINNDSVNPKFRAERIYRLKSSPGAAGRSPESHPQFWVLQGE